MVEVSVRATNYLFANSMKVEDFVDLGICLWENVNLEIWENSQIYLPPHPGFGHGQKLSKFVCFQDFIFK